MKNLKRLNVRQLIMFDTAVLVYKSQNEQVPIRTSVMFQNFEVNHCFNTRLVSLERYTLSRCARNFGQRSITYHGMKLWNTLPNEIKDAQSIDFKQKSERLNCLKSFKKYTVIFSFLFCLIISLLPLFCFQVLL